MPNARHPGWVVSSFTVPAELLGEARAAVARSTEVSNLSEVVRAALERFVRESEES